MDNKEFVIEIAAPPEKVWNVLWDDATFRDWASNIDEGIHLIGEIVEGASVQFVSGENGYGVTSVIETLVPNELILFRHITDTIEGGTQEREKEWTGGTERYALTEHNGTTLLKVRMDIPPSQEETMNIRVPKALERVRALAEQS